MTSPANILDKVPAWSRPGIGRGLTIGLSVAIPLCLLLATWVYVKGRTLPTKQDVKAVRDAVQQLSEDQVVQMAAFAARQRSRQDSMRYAALFDTLSTTLIEPGIKRLKSLENQVAHLEDLAGVNRELLREQVDVVKDTRSRMSLMQHQMNGSPVEDTQREMMRMLKKMETTLDSLKKIPARTNKVKL